VNLVDLLVHGPQSIHVIDLVGDGRSMTRIRGQQEIRVDRSDSLGENYFIGFQVRSVKNSQSLEGRRRSQPSIAEGTWQKIVNSGRKQRSKFGNECDSQSRIEYRPSVAGKDLSICERTHVIESQKLSI
jgi:hypothetical protein